MGLEMAAFACDRHGKKNGPMYTEDGLDDEPPKFVRSEGVPRGPTPPPTPSPPTPAPTGKSCGSSGCGGDYKKADDCQCTWGCKVFGNCCSDFEDSCSVKMSFCASRGCGSEYDKYAKSQCNKNCAKYNNC